MARTYSLPTTRPAGKSARLPDNDGRDKGSWVSASLAVRRYRTSHNAVRSGTRLSNRMTNNRCVRTSLGSGVGNHSVCQLLELEQGGPR